MSFYPLVRKDFHNAAKERFYLEISDQVGKLENFTKPKVFWSSNVAIKKALIRLF